MPTPRSRLHAVSLLVLVLLAISPPARAIGPGFDAFLGYSRTGTDTFHAGQGGLNGWEGAFHLKLRPFVGAEGDVSYYGLGAASSIPRTTSVLFGPRITIGAAGIKLFVHGLVGGEHTGGSDSGVSTSALAVAAGGGLDVRIAPFFAWRVAGDYLEAPTQTPAAGTRARFSTGLVFRF